MNLPENTQKRFSFIVNFFYFALIAAILFICFKYVVFWLMPFLLGFAIAFILKPLINLISQHSRINRKFCAVICVLLFYGTIGVLVWLLGAKLIVSMKEVFDLLPHTYKNSIEPLIGSAFSWLEGLFKNLDPSTVEILNSVSQQLTQSLGNFVTSFSSNAVSFIAGMATSIPSFLLSFLFMILSSFFIALDYYRVVSFVMNQFTDKIKSIMFDVKDYCIGTLFHLAKAYLILMTITFAELSIGLLILRVPNAVGIAALIALADALPLIGTGGIVIPWIIIEMFRHNFSLAVGLLIVYVIITIIRNILEPKIVGKQIGLHPLITLLCMYIGMKLFGFLGIIILPVLVIIVKNLNDTGKIKLFKY